MRTNALRNLALTAGTIASLLLSGCVTTWQYSEAPVVSANKLYAVTVPKGWACLANDGQGNILATRDGISLQLIQVSSADIANELPFAKEKARPDMSAEQLVDLYYKDVFKNPSHQAVEMERAGPAQLGGVDGFELIFTYTADGGLRYRAHATGAVKGEKLVTMTYRAPTRYYYERDDDVLPAALAGFRFN